MFGGWGHGAIAKAIVVSESMISPKPETYSFEEAAAFKTAYLTAYVGLIRRGQLQRGETLLVHGASGGVGIAAIELGKAMGAKVIAAASTQDKVDMCMTHGADEGFIYPSGNLDRDQQKQLSNKIKELTGGMGANVVYDPVGDSYSEPCLRATAWEGRYLVIGFAAGEIPKIPLNITLLKGCQVVGVFWGAWVGMCPDENNKNFAELFKLHAEGKINPEVSQKYTLENSADAFLHLANRKAKGKVIINM